MLKHVCDINLANRTLTSSLWSL